MLEDEINILIANIYSFLLTDKKIPKHGNLIKKHSINLFEQGELSFPNDIKCWIQYLDQKLLPNEANLMKYIGKGAEILIKESKKWNLSIEKVIELKGRLFIHVDRPKAMSLCFFNSHRNNQILLSELIKENSSICADPLDHESTCITSLRVCCLTRVIQHLYGIHKCKDNVSERIFVTSRSSSKFGENKVILCGTVLNSDTGMKETASNADDFIRLRQEELTLIAQHKYGVRVSTESKWKEFISKLGKSAVNFELLQTKPSSAVKIKFDSSSGSSKRAAFILYNCARLETIIRTYNERVEAGSYPQLPKIDDADFSLLNQDDEWSIIFNYILGFPSFLKSTVDLEQGRCEFRPHLICSFLSSMVGEFSQYYRRVRILTEPRKHLLPVLFARIYMLKSLNDTLKICLKILNIDSVTQMYSSVLFYTYSDKMN
ncbi:unnamed protein product, partial [Leptidea sinapis]